MHLPQPIALEALARHLSLSDAAALQPLLAAVNDALRTVRGDPEAMLFLPYQFRW